MQKQKADIATNQWAVPISWWFYSFLFINIINLFIYLINFTIETHLFNVIVKAQEK